MELEELTHIRDTIAKEHNVARKKLQHLNALQEEVQREVTVRANMLDCLDALIEMKED